MTAGTCQPSSSIFICLSQAQGQCLASMAFSPYTSFSEAPEQKFVMETLHELSGLHSPVN
jgi:hypothetical protein